MNEVFFQKGGPSFFFSLTLYKILRTIVLPGKGEINNSDHLKAHKVIYFF